jgi:hypothetical protein
LVVNEPVTTPSSTALGNAHAVDVVVWDSDPTVAAARAADPDRIGQHGLEIVKAVTPAARPGIRTAATSNVADPRAVGTPADDSSPYRVPVTKKQQLS